MSEDVIRPKSKPRELSWLEFNACLLDEAANPSLPLFDRLKFLGYYSNNLDEFFRVRVATLKKMRDTWRHAGQGWLHDPRQVLEEIEVQILDLARRFARIYEALLHDLEDHEIFFVNEQNLPEHHRNFVLSYFRQTVRSKLVPILLGPDIPFPDFKDDSIFLVACFQGVNVTPDRRYCLIQIPMTLPRFLLLPRRDERQEIMFLDDVIRFGLEEVFPTFEYESVETFTIKLTKDSDLNIENDYSQTVLKRVNEALRRRKEGEPVRFLHDRKLPADALQFLTRKMKLSKEDAVLPGGRYHNFKDFMKFPAIRRGPEYLGRQVIPLPFRAIHIREGIFRQIKERDALLNTPYQAFDVLVDLLREAALDPQVESIQITLYRLAPDSNIANALINAARNGKRIFVLVELQARFDEAANVAWSHTLKEEGAEVVYGVPGLKVHAKLLLITRREVSGKFHYCMVSTGNFNEVTALSYTDHYLITARQEIANEVEQVFDFFRSNFKIPKLEYLWASPFDYKERLVQLIKRETQIARRGKPAHIWIKLNNFTEEDLIQLLYDASCAGVKIRLLVRGMFSLHPGVPGVSENIEAIRIVDTYLEHARFFMVGNGGHEKVFLSTGDWMLRNFEQRVEIVVPILDRRLKRLLKESFQLHWNDNVKARNLSLDNSGFQERFKTRKQIRGQRAFYSYLKRAQ